MVTRRTRIDITPSEAAELSHALFSSGSALARDLAPVFSDIAAAGSAPSSSQSMAPRKATTKTSLS